MTVFDPTQYPELRNLFPELTPVQFETALLFAFGIPQKKSQCCVQWRIKW
ncbi:hypothetical protein WH390_04100 [Candidatus Arsenophonus nilaparvatae]